MKYEIPKNQAAIISNKLGLVTKEEIALSEFEGFLQAEIMLTESLTARTKFNIKYILKIHKLSLGHLYSFAGKLRDVNLSKGNFPFASAQYLSQTMQKFEDDILLKLPNKYNSREELIKDIAIVHAELLLIHPFREGNGRTARILANLMSRKGDHGPLNFEKIGENEFEKYVTAIQKTTGQENGEMIEFIRSIFPV